MRNCCEKPSWIKLILSNWISIWQIWCRNHYHPVWEKHLIFHKAIIFLYSISIYLSYVPYISTSCANLFLHQSYLCQTCRKEIFFFSLVNKSCEFPTSIMMYLNYPHYLKRAKWKKNFKIFGEPNQRTKPFFLCIHIDEKWTLTLEPSFQHFFWEKILNFFIRSWQFRCLKIQNTRQLQWDQ